MVALALSCCAQANPPASIGDSCRMFVQGFYDWYAPIAVRKHANPAWELAVTTRPGDFSPELRRAITKDSKAQRKSKDIVGLDFDPFLNSQDPSQKFAVESVAVRANHCRATVYGISEGQKRERVAPVADRVGGRWRFANFSYLHPKTGTYDLLNLLKQMAADRHPQPIQ
jgi:hypothetical protein